MRYLYASARKDVLRRLADRWALAVWLGIPLLIGGLVTAMSGGASGPLPKARVLVVDDDASTMSALLVGALAQGPLAQMVETESVAEVDGRERLDAGEATALLVIPAGFGAAVLGERPTALRLVTNPAQRILPRIVADALDVMGEAVFYAHRVMDPELRDMLTALAQDEAPSVDAQRLSLAVGASFQRIGPLIANPPVNLSIVTPPSSMAEVPAALLYLPGVILMALFFVAQGTSDDVWAERRLGTLQRSLAGPRGAAAYLAGKLLGSLALLALVGAASLGVGMAWFGLPLRLLPLALAWSLLAGAVLNLLMQAIQLHASSERAGSILTTVLLFPLLMLGGSFFPSEAMPGWMAALGGVTPNGHAVERLKDILLERADAGPLAGSCGAFLAAAALLYAYQTRRLRRGFLPR